MGPIVALMMVDEGAALAYSKDMQEDKEQGLLTRRQT